jgi:hypothetical protein
MKNVNRLIFATLLGALFGFACYGLASRGQELLPWPIALQIISSRTLIGFAIGLCCFKLGNWTLRGLILGLIFSLPLAFSGMMAPVSPDFSKAGMFIATLGLGAFYGLLIEIFTMVIFKAKQKK